MVLKFCIPAVGALLAVASASCPEFCPADYDPVCGDDGKLYSNLCALQMSSCECDYCVHLVTDCADNCGSGKSLDLKCSTIQGENCTLSTCGTVADLKLNEGIFVESDVTPSVPNLPNDYTNTIPDLPAFSDTLSSLNPTMESSLLPPEAQEGNEMTDFIPQVSQTELNQPSNIDSQLQNPSSCNFGCSNVHDPVCGSNRVIYDNQCKFEEAKCQNQNRLSKAKMGVCQLTENTGDNAISAQAGDCERQCPLIYEPICGNDGLTYDNNCLFNVARCHTDGALKMEFEGSCSAREASQAAPTSGNPSPQNIMGGACSKERNLVCASDGLTYANMCLFNTVAGRIHITVVSSGMCDQRNQIGTASVSSFTPSIEAAIAPTGIPEGQSVPQPQMEPVGDIKCPELYFPICGTDGVTYPNMCIMNKRSQRINVPIGIKQQGECPMHS